MGLDADKEHDVERVEGLVSGVGVSLELDGRHFLEVLWSFWIKVMVGGDQGKVLREITVVHVNTVFEHEFCGLGAVEFVKGGEVPVLFFDVMEEIFKFFSSKFFAQLFGAK